ncbi:BAI3 [Bugula neritina]|uniref:BAI3 n=1 Tax=Bugula neritina TaxID=10212 RepID=A0A7J7J644_BUGNE|nr:BAI3 [Bugula neritina]
MVTIILVDFITSESTWGLWKAWSTCSKSCGDGTQSRERHVTPGWTRDRKLKERGCAGPATEVRACNLGCCPVDGQWSYWSHWMSFGGLKSTSRREKELVVDPSHHAMGKYCSGKPEEIRDYGKSSND